jgi:hypothetical protein
MPTKKIKYMAGRQNMMEGGPATGMEGGFASNVWKKDISAVRLDEYANLSCYGH